jgi:transcriptional regulator with PAS, ATPase and Fis domain
MDKLENYTWPGNVRQLENIMKQIVVREDETLVDDFFRNDAVRTPGQVPQQAQKQQQRVPVAAGVEHEEESSGPRDYSLKKRVSRAVEAEEVALISEVLNKVNWNRRKASELLDISYRSLLYKIKEYKINEIK